ncbi:hypothetical protein J4E91_004498 [Alternaria rosae]|nr:hypothetical protein J4E91_004498 [Alternaria rosae]
MMPASGLTSGSELPRKSSLNDESTYIPSVDDRDIRIMNTTILADLHGISAIPQLYQMLFHRTREFAATVHKLVDVAPASWAEAACLLVNWGVNVLRHKEVGLERFLHSQRESLYWILDDALLMICVDQWDPPSSDSAQPRTSSSSTPKLIPWDKATAPVTLALSRVQDLLPLWAGQDLQDWGKWGLERSYTQAPYMTAGWFRRSTKFLHESSRIYEIWRTLRRWGGGQLPAELASVIMEDVAKSENLPMGDLRLHYFPKGKSRAQLI